MSSFDQPDNIRPSEKTETAPGRPISLTSLLPFGEALVRSVIEKGASPLAGGFLCMLVADPVDREKELKTEAKKKFPTRPDIQGLYVKDKLAKEFPDTRTALNDEHRAILRGWEQFPDPKTGVRGRLLVKKEVLGWLGDEAHPRLTRPELAELNMLRWHPQLTDELRKLGIRREVARLGTQDNPLSLEDNAKLDAWTSLPRGTRKQRQALAEKLIAWRKVEQGDMPGDSDIVRLAAKVRKGENLSRVDNNRLRAWREHPYSKDHRSPEWARAAKGFADDDAVAKWFDEARRIRLKQLNGEALTREELVKRGAYIAFPDNPRMWELTVRKRLTTTDAKKYPRLTAREEAEREAWETFSDVTSGSSERGRELSIKKTLDPKKFPAKLDKELLILVSLERRNSR
jgi:hypothetical protein